MTLAELWSCTVATVTQIFMCSFDLGGLLAPLVYAFETDRRRLQPVSVFQRIRLNLGGYPAFELLFVFVCASKQGLMLLHQI